MANIIWSGLVSHERERAQVSNGRRQGTFCAILGVGSLAGERSSSVCLAGWLFLCRSLPVCGASGLSGLLLSL